MRVLTAAAMQELDRRTILEAGIPGAVLMENAGSGVAEVVAQRYAVLHPGPVLVLCGRGNNGGDGFVIARHLRAAGWQVRLVLLAERAAVAGDAAGMLDRFVQAGGEVVEAPDAARLEPVLAAAAGSRLCIDALLGTGFARPPEGVMAAAIAWLNGQPAPVVAVDLPSGVDASSGCIPGVAVRAALTVTFACPKVGLVSYPGAGLAGDLVTVPIGIPAPVAAAAPDEFLLVDADEARALLPPRPADGHKGTFGHLLVVAGSTGKSGAAVMASAAGLRGGAGLVTLACPAGMQAVAAAHLVEVMTAPLPEVAGALSLQAMEELLALSDGKQAVAIGPGLGLNDETAALVRRFLKETPLPVVVDADALNALAAHPEVFACRRGRATVLTPHPGEMARLCGRSVAGIQADRVAAAREFAAAHGVVLVLKGARTVTACPDGRVRINGSGHPGMASGGMGDILTGLIGGLLAQGMTPEAAAALGVYLHGLAGDRLRPLYGDAGLLATDLLRELPIARHSLLKEPSC
ncbi:MAG: NAD(P)H-hydrate dehydratase [Deltaproteobacteria bacterium]|nr:MAG: NAD(P)H-hydrate dehydratase [Deltaproteobacteria bacterium]